MEELKNYEGLYCVESFDPRIVRWFRQNHPGIIRGQLMEHLQPGQKRDERRPGVFRAQSDDEFPHPS